MNILSGFFTEDLAIDLGTVNTIVYTPTQGVVLNEPSVVAVNKYSREVISVGSPALKLLGREPNDTEVYRPARGRSTKFKYRRCSACIISGTEALSKAQSPGVACRSSRRSSVDRSRAARDAKAGRRELIDEGLAAAIGAGLISKTSTTPGSHIGGGTDEHRNSRVGRVVIVSRRRRQAMETRFVLSAFALRSGIGERTIEHSMRLGSAAASSITTRARR